MFPELFHIGSITVYSYGFCIITGVVLAYLFFYIHRNDLNLNLDKISEFFLYCFAGVFLGGKLFYFLERPGYFLQNPGDFFSKFGQGFVFYGSFLVTIPLVIYWFRKEKISVARGFDYTAIGGAFVHGFGKIGCFMAGCCHGKVCEKAQWWNVTFTNPHTVAEPINTPMYPTQLWDAAIILGMVAFFFWYFPRKKFNGELFILYSLIYGVGRFFTEFYRGDDSRGFVFGNLMTHSQFIALIIILVSVPMYIYFYRKSRKTQA